MKTYIFGFIGLGLIGGSIAKALRQGFPNATIIAFDTNPETLTQAQKDGVITTTLSSIDASFSSCHIIFLCAAVGKNDKNLTALRSFLPKDIILTDVGSVKGNIHKTIEALQLSHCFIGGHPMAGSEKSGYANASSRLLENAYYILSPSPTVPKDKVSVLYEVVSATKALPIVMDYHKHDYITAAVSHLPHIIAASLVNLIQTHDDKDGSMKTIAAGGFKDITRIASSSPEMWQQICEANQENILSLLDDYIESLQQTRQSLFKLESQELHSLFYTARNYRDSFTNTSGGPLQKIYSLYVDIPDKTGELATIATILANHHISIKNIGIVHNREFEEGVLRVEFYDESSTALSAEVLRKSGYSIYVRR